MTSCSLIASGLVPEVGGAVPTFSYRQTGHSGDYFGVQMTYLRGTSTCYQTGALPQFTPVIQNEEKSFTVDCVFNTQGTTYTGIFCPNAPVTQIPDGVLTVSYKNNNQGQPTPIPFYATFGSSPSPKAVTMTANAVATSTATSITTVSPGYASTITVSSAATQTQTSTIIVTQTQTTTNTNTVSSCSTSSSSSRSSSSSAPSSSTSSSIRSSSSTPASSSTSSALPTPSGISNSCPADNGKTVSTAAGTFQIVCSYDRDGVTQGLFYTDNGLLGCINLCANTKDCVWATYFKSNPDNACYLKFGEGTPNYNVAAWGATLLSPSSTVASVPSTTTTVKSSTSSLATSLATSSQSTSSLASTTSPSSTSTQSPSSSQSTSRFTTTALSSSSLSTASSTPAISSTQKSSSNAAVSSSSVVLSGTASSASAGSATTSTGATTTSTGPVATSSVVCPASDGQTIITNAGTFVVECGIDHSGGDMSGSPVYPGSYEACIAVCAARSGCVDVSYIPNGPCYLKSVLGTAIQNTNIVGGRLVGSRASSTIISSSTGTSISVSATSTATPTASGSPTQIVTVTTTISGAGYQCACTPTSGLDSGPDAISCPSSDGQTYTSNCGATYAIECYSDRYGADIPGGTSSAYTLNECIADCDTTDGCVDVSYVVGSPGTCYKKSSIAEIRTNANIYGARLLTGCQATSKLKLHRKRVVREPAETKRKIEKRGVYGPDYTYIQGTTTVTRTATTTSVVYTTVTVTPANSGTTTKTAYTTATSTATVTNGATITQTQQTTVTTCPAVTKRAVL